MNRLTDILERLEKATGPSYDLDVAIGEAVGYPAALLQPPPNWTYSIDAASSLVEKLLPSWAYGFDSGIRTCIAFVDPHDYADRMFAAQYTAEAPKPALALLTALFRALSTQEDGRG